MKNYTLLTGATGGLGHSFAKLLASNGHNLIITGTNETKLNTLYESLKSEFKNIDVIAKICDLSSLEDRQSFIKEVLSIGNINFLINNAGFIAEGDFVSFENEKAIKMIRVNCEATIDITQTIINARDKSIDLNIITIASLAGYYPMPHMALYSATKSFLKNFMVALAVELKKENVYITTVCPSGMPTTADMKNAIKSQGFFGKITSASADKVAKISLKANKKHKTVVVPLFINKTIKFISKFASEKFIAKYIGSRWKKSQKKRNMC